jgi:hypothetical protein
MGSLAFFRPGMARALGALRRDYPTSLGGSRRARAQFLCAALLNGRDLGRNYEEGSYELSTSHVPLGFVAVRKHHVDHRVRR